MPISQVHTRFVSEFSERLSPVLTGEVRREPPPQKPLLSLLPALPGLMSKNLSQSGPQRRHFHCLRYRWRSEVRGHGGQRPPGHGRVGGSADGDATGVSRSLRRTAGCTAKDGQGRATLTDHWIVARKGLSALAEAPFWISEASAKLPLTSGRRVSIISIEVAITLLDIAFPSIFAEAV